MTPINLQTMTKQIALTSTAIQKAINEKGERFNLKVAPIAGKIPGLEKLPGDMTIASINKEKESGNFYGKTLTVYNNDEGKPTVYTPDLKPVEKAKPISYETGFNGYQIIELQGVKLQIDISVSDDFRENALDRKPVTGEGFPDAIHLADVPHPTVHLKDLEPGTKYRVIKHTGIHKKHQTNRYLIQNLTTTVEFEVYENADLRDIIIANKIPCEFKLGSVRKITGKENGNGKNGKKAKESEAWKVQLIDTQQPTFEDIAI